jgi:hypothetical protein
MTFANTELRSALEGFSGELLQPHEGGVNRQLIHRTTIGTWHWLS